MNGALVKGRPGGLTVSPIRLVIDHRILTPTFNENQIFPLQLPPAFPPSTALPFIPALPITVQGIVCLV